MSLAGLWCWTSWLSHGAIVEVTRARGTHRTLMVYIELSQEREGIRVCYTMPLTDLLTLHECLFYGFGEKSPGTAGS